MKRLSLCVIALLGVLYSFAAIAQPPVWDCNGATGTYTLAGTPIKAQCPTAGTNPPPVNPPPVTPPPSMGCSASQLSTPIAGKTFARQCFGTMVLNPSGVSPSGDLTDLGALLGHRTFPNYLYSGQSPTFTISSGYYVALAFTPASAGLIKFTANNSYGVGGAISLSTFPGGLTSGALGVICAYTSGGLNSLIVSTSQGSCLVTQGRTYYINFAATNANGDQLCFGGTAGNCADTRVSYAFTARAQ